MQDPPCRPRCASIRSCRRLHAGFPRRRGFSFSRRSRSLLPCPFHTISLSGVLLRHPIVKHKTRARFRDEVRGERKRHHRADGRDVGEDEVVRGGAKGGEDPVVLDGEDETRSDPGGGEALVRETGTSGCCG